jgi:hypothetical protein
VFARPLLHAKEMSGIVDAFKTLPGDAAFPRHESVSASCSCSDEVFHLLIPDGVRNDEESDAMFAALSELVGIVSFTLQKSTVAPVKVSNFPVVLFTVTLEGQLQPRAIAIQFCPITLIAGQPFGTGLRKFVLKRASKKPRQMRSLTYFVHRGHHAFRWITFTGAIQKSWLFLQRHSSFPFRPV